MTRKEGIIARIGRLGRRAWLELVAMTEWTQNPNIDPPRIGERGDVLNPSAGWSAPNPRVGDGETLDRRGEQEG